MRQLVCASVLFIAALGTATARGGEVRLNGRTFSLPDGFELELAAGPPLVNRPIVGDFDEQGRLYVADSSGSNDNVQKQLAEKPHRVVRLEDTDGDGRFDRSTVFADKMMFPEGAMWFDGSLYVAAPPSIWKLTDTDGDGVADRRVEWFQGKTLTGCANDLHGPYLGLDGWIYWCKGAFAQQMYVLPNRKTFATRAAHIFRCRPDGSAIEPVMTGGMDNPVDVVFTPGAERIFTTTFLQHPGGGNRDGLIHAVYGGVYGKVHDVIDGHKRTSPDVMPVLAHYGAAAPCGLTRYDSEVFGTDYRDNLFATLFNMHKVVRNVLKPEGATFSDSVEDFVVAVDYDFHPTDVHTDADGSLVVLDTGGWYKLCCPTSQLHKPDVLGAIYRVRRKGAANVDDPRGLRLEWAKLKNEELTTLFDDSRPAVRKRAVETLAARGGNALPAISETVKLGRSPEARRNAIWTATRIDGESARSAVHPALNDSDEVVRQAAIHSVSVRRDRSAVALLTKLLATGTAQNKRAAAEALGRLGDPSVSSALLAAAARSESDRVLEHSLIYAVIELDDTRAVSARLATRDTRERRAALIALDQMDSSKLAPDAVASALDSPDPALKATASWIVSRHPEWAGALTGFLQKRLDAANLSSSDRADLEGLLARYAHAPSVQSLLSDRVRDASAPREARELALRAMAQSGIKDVPSSWVAALTAALAGGDVNLTRQVVSTARALPLKAKDSRDLTTALLKVGTDSGTAIDTRLDALAAIPGGVPEVSPSLYAFLAENLTTDKPVAVRSAATEVVSRARLSREQLGSLVDTLKGAGPLEVDRLLSAFEQKPDLELGRKVVAALKQSAVRASLHVDTLKPHLSKFGKDLEKDSSSLYESLNADAAKQKAKLDELSHSLKGGDIRRGQAVFNSTKASCSACHAIGYLGGRVGPDLTRIGQIRSEHDLLEAIVFPSASFVRSYEPVIIATKDGRTVSGLPRKDAPDEMILTTGANQEAKIARGDIEEMKPGTVSVMPAGLDQQLSPQDLADLVAFLRACK